MGGWVICPPPARGGDGRLRGGYPAGRPVCDCCSGYPTTGGYPSTSGYRAVEIPTKNAKIAPKTRHHYFPDPFTSFRWAHQPFFTPPKTLNTKYELIFYPPRAPKPGLTGYPRITGYPRDRVNPVKVPVTYPAAFAAKMAISGQRIPGPAVIRPAGLEHYCRFYLYG